MNLKKQMTLKQNEILEQQKFHISTDLRTAQHELAKTGQQMHEMQKAFVRLEIQLERLVFNRASKHQKFVLIQEILTE